MSAVGMKASTRTESTAITTAMISLAHLAMAIGRKAVIVQASMPTAVLRSMTITSWAQAAEQEVLRPLKTSGCLVLAALQRIRVILQLAVAVILGGCHLVAIALRGHAKEAAQISLGMPMGAAAAVAAVKVKFEL